MSVKPYQILILEPDNDWYDKTFLTLSKRKHEVTRVKSGEKVIDICKKNRPDLLILEYDIEPNDGVEIALDIRDDVQLRTIPIVFYSETSDKYTQIAAYEGGADLYIKKGIKQRLFASMVQSVLRRCYELEEKSTDIKQFGDMIIDEEQVMVYKNGNPLNLSKKEFQMLLLLTSKPGKVYRRKDILLKIWGDDVIVGDRNIDTHIKKLRRKLGKDVIQTSRGMGYKFMTKSA